MLIETIYSMRLKADKKSDDEYNDYNINMIMNIMVIIMNIMFIVTSRTVIFIISRTLTK